MASTGSSSSVQEGDPGVVPADLVIALTTYNDAGSIEAVARALQEGAARAGETAVRFVLADAGSTDGTPDAARELLGPHGLVEVEVPGSPELIEPPYHGRPHRGAALQAVFRSAQRLQARACAVVDASRRCPDPDLLERLAAPVLGGDFDYVLPRYARHVNEGALTRGIVYPMFRALYGVRLHQPASTEFGCSGALIAAWLEQDFWELEQGAAGVDLWLAIAAASAQFRICEAALGSRGAPGRAGTPDLSTTVAQVVGALFAEVDHRAGVWQRVRGSVEVPLIGSAQEAPAEGPALNLDALTRSYRLGYRELREIWAHVLPPRTIVELRKLADSPDERFAFDDRLWATIVYDFAFGYSLRVMPREHLLRSLTPLYSGWLASFARQMQGADATAVDERTERLCLAFETEKRYLISRWRWPERFR